MSDYDVLVHTGKEYANDANGFRELMTVFEEHINENSAKHESDQ